MRPTFLALAFLVAVSGCSEGTARPAAPEPSTATKAAAPASPTPTPKSGPGALADRIGCTGVRKTDNLAHLDEVACTLKGHEVTITDWSGYPAKDKQGLLDELVGMGYQIIAVTPDVTVGTDSMPVAIKIHEAVGGSWLSAG